MRCLSGAAVFVFASAPPSSSMFASCTHNYNNDKPENNDNRAAKFQPVRQGARVAWRTWRIWWGHKRRCCACNRRRGYRFGWVIFPLTFPNPRVIFRLRVVIRCASPGSATQGSKMASSSPKSMTMTFRTELVCSASSLTATFVSTLALCF